MAYENHVYTVTCVVAHTCPSHRPNLTWSRSEGEISEVHRELYTGYWEVQSILTFMPKDKDDHSQLTCTAWFAGELKASKTVTVYIKREIFSLLSGLPNICAVQSQNVSYSFYREGKLQLRHHSRCCGDRNSSYHWSRLLVHLKKIQVRKPPWTHAWTTSECYTLFFNSWLLKETYIRTPKPGWQVNKALMTGTWGTHFHPDVSKVYVSVTCSMWNRLSRLSRRYGSPFFKFFFSYFDTFGFVMKWLCLIFRTRSVSPGSSCSDQR